MVVDYSKWDDLDVTSSDDDSYVPDYDDDDFEDDEYLDDEEEKDARTPEAGGESESEDTEWETDDGEHDDDDDETEEAEEAMSEDAAKDFKARVKVAAGAYVLLVEALEDLIINLDDPTRLTPQEMREEGFPGVFDFVEHVIGKHPLKYGGGFEDFEEAARKGLAISKKLKRKRVREQERRRRGGDLDLQRGFLGPRPEPRASEEDPPCNCPCCNPSSAEGGSSSGGFNGIPWNVRHVNTAPSRSKGPFPPSASAPSSSKAKSSSSSTPAGPEVPKELGLQAMRVISDHLRGMDCTRCGKSCNSAGPCRVPHPVHLLEDRETMFSGNRMEATRFCHACGETFTTILTRGQAGGPIIKEEYVGPAWCYESCHHTPHPLPEGDERRVFAECVNLFTESGGRGMAEMVNALSGRKGVKVLTIQPTLSENFSDEKFDLEPVLPALEEFILHDCSPTSLKLTRQSVPNLRKVQLRNLPDDCQLTLDLPEMTELDIQYWCPTTEEMFDHFAAAVRNASKLESFSSYKLWIPELEICSNHLTSINMRRSDSMRTLTLWSPCLKELNLVSCYGIDEVVILDEDPREEAAGGQEGEGAGNSLSKFNVDLSYSNNLDTLRAHPRVLNVETDTSDQSSPAEAMLQNLMATMGAY